MRRHRLLFLTIVALVVVSAACGGTGESLPIGSGPNTVVPPVSTTVAETEPPTSAASSTSVAASPAGESIQDLVADGSLEVDVVSPEGGISGMIVEVMLTNRSDEDLDAVVPCGLVFEPVPGVQEQRMMVVQPVAARVPPGASVIVRPFVACIDSDEEPASAGAVYVPASVADGDLLTFAQCLCRRDLDSELDPTTGGMDLQFAVWAVTDGDLAIWRGDPGDLTGALGNLTGGSLDIDAEDLKELQGTNLDQMIAAMQAFMEQIGTGAQRWLDECEIDLAK
ncbi:MAG: hypothetical protein GWP04_04815 [Gammaproteobacteria bacterium]|nr:hypothetical protein [Gammaproteobacteria bacterium]